MIDEIYENSLIQLKVFIRTFEKEFDYPGGIKEIGHNSTNDLIILLNKVNFFNREITFPEMKDFYESGIKEGIGLGLMFGKTCMLKKIKENQISKEEVMNADLEEYGQFFQNRDQIEEIIEIPTGCDNPKERRFRVIEGPDDIGKEIQMVILLSKLIDDDHKELVKILYRDLLEEFGLFHFNVKYKCNKKIKMGTKSLKPMLKSCLFKDRTGQYPIKELIRDYLTNLIDSGMELGVRIGFKIVLEDIQKGLLDYDSIPNMNETEFMMYIHREHGEYIIKNGGKRFK